MPYVETKGRLVQQLLFGHILTQRTDCTTWTTTVCDR